jgi:hypothetical protein
MLAGALGVRLVVLVGDTIPLPAPYALTSSLQSVTVTNDAQGSDGFQITFKLAKDTLIEYGVLLQRTLEPFKRIVLGVLFGALPEVLIDGVITNHQFTPSAEPGATRLSVTGRDVSQMLDLEERNEEYPNQPDFVIATRLIASYAQYGLVPQPTPTTDIPIFLQRIPRQQETDLAFLRRLAARNGFVFYVEPITLGVNLAYFGPEDRLKFPQPALTLGMGPAGNLVGIHFTRDALAPVATSGSFVEPITKTRIPIPPLPPLKLPPLALQPERARRTTIARDTAQAGPAQAALATLSAATNAPDALVAEGEVDAVRYGHVLRARKLVGVRGVGLAHDGLYFVRRVTHTITPGTYKQQFTLSREGTGSLLPAVPP